MATRSPPEAGRASGWCWIRAGVVSLIAPVIGMLVGSLPMVPILNAIPVELDRFDRFLVMLPAVVVGALAAGALAGLAVGRRRRGLVPPMLASLVVAVVSFGVVLVGLRLEATWVYSLGGASELATWLLQAAAILLALRFGPTGDGA